jgi:hypothetical protein
MKSDKSNTISSEFDIIKADQHIPAFEELARLFNTESDLGKDSIQDVWLRVFKTELKSKSMTVKRVGLIGSCYIFISILLMNGDVSCLISVDLFVSVLQDTADYGSNDQAG